LSAVARLLAFFEQYSDLKANLNFLSLQSQLERAENRIAVARRGLHRSEQTAPQRQCADAALARVVEPRLKSAMSRL
jgi:LemA family